ncbi:Phox (PX) domain-containing protein [Actinidia rufa]|uniref:Phox (PX) domain-containing protein n=1 Tax=Actinidia rufa TaxID=165716 RepID=A0A7J0H367_9ERIC|nr:Phox (PX) domain-containing protein [Actinidia rufa]
MSLCFPEKIQKSTGGGDESPVSSQYSSCGDSEFERYCSANSVMGTPRDVGSLENISLGGGFARKFGERKLSSSGGSGCLSDHGIDLCEGKSILEVRNDVEGQGLVGITDDMECSSRHDFDRVYTGDMMVAALSDGETTVSQQCCRVQLELYLLSRPILRDSGRCSDEDNASSRFEHSEGEDSMFGYGTEDEQKMDLLHKRNMQYRQDTKVERENSLFMSSSVAFGSDDWDDFEQDTGGPDITSIMLGKRQPNIETERILPSKSSQTKTGSPGVCPDQEVVTDFSAATSQVLGADELAGCIRNGSLNPFDFLDGFCEMEQGKDAEDIHIANNQAGNLDESVDYLKTFSSSDIFQREQDILPQEAPSKKCLNFMGGDLRNGSPLLSIREFDNVNDSLVSECHESKKSTLLLNPLSDIAASQLCLASTKTPEDQRIDFLREPFSSLPMDENNIKRPLKDSPVIFNLFEDHPKSVKTENLELNEFYNEVVHEMEEILLDSTESLARLGWILPAPWSSVERESRKFPSSFPSALIWFFSSPKVVPSSAASNTFNPQSPFSAKGTNSDNVLTLGKSISLVVEIRAYKSIKQILESQHNTCAACHKHFDDGKTRMLEFVQTLGWGKPRLCEYTGRLFCSSCHTNEIAVLPARVLHHWDFTQHPVSQLAKSYLDSIYDQPMLCVSAVSPILFSKVPALVQVTGVRKRIGAMLPYVRCPFRMSIYRGLASRRYLLESYDFFALRDLIDLSKGPFAVLPVMVDTVLRKILEHITEQCLVCCDVGVPCNARQACDDPSSLIFPFQEGEIERCRSCKSGFHKPCFRKIRSCPCGQPLKQDGQKGVSTSASLKIDNELSSAVNLLGTKSDSSSTMRFLSGFFSKARQEKLSGPKDSDTTILMGSLPSTSL